MLKTKAHFYIHKVQHLTFNHFKSNLGAKLHHNATNLHKTYYLHVSKFTLQKVSLLPKLSISQQYKPV